MILVETSALVALLLKEPGFETLIDKIVARGGALAATSFVEAGLVYGSKKGATALAEMETLIGNLGLIVIPFTPDHARGAAKAFLAYGKGRHPAGLNFGDCMSYAVAKAEGLPLLFTGADFARTDLAAA